MFQGSDEYVAAVEDGVHSGEFVCFQLNTVLPCFQFIQRMAAYACAYNDFTIVDGTHNTVMYHLKLMPYTNFDCLGKNVIYGIVLDESENGESIHEGLNLFGLCKRGSTLMTDGGSAFPLVAERARMNHILCSQHFQRDVFASAGGLGEYSDQLKGDANKLIFSKLSLSDSWDDKYHAAITRYSSHPKAIFCLRKIFKDKDKVCQSFSGMQDISIHSIAFLTKVLQASYSHADTCRRREEKV